MLNKALKFEAFCYYYLTRHLEFKFSPMHLEWFRKLESKRIAIAAPRDHAKSTIFSFFYPLFLLLEEPTNIVIISATAALAEVFLAKIKHELENNTELRKAYGNQAGTKWTNDTLYLKNGAKLMAKGAGAQIRGFRPHVIILDDLETSEGVLNEDRRDTLTGWYLKDCINTLEPMDQAVIVGTILHPLSLLNLIIINPKDIYYNKCKYSALKEDDTSAWEEKWPVYELHKRRDEIGEIAFEQEYQNNPIPDKQRIFKPQPIEQAFYKELPKGLSYTTTVDPGLTVGDKSDFTAIITVGTDEDKIMYVAEVIQKKMFPEELVEEVFRVQERWGSHTIGLETVAFQKMLKYKFDDECRKRHKYPYIKELTLDVSEKGRKKRFRIEALQPYIEQGRIRLHESQKELYDQLITYPTCKHDDMVDALASQLEIVSPGKKVAQDLPKNCFLADWNKHIAKVGRKGIGERKIKNHRFHSWLKSKLV